jgi:3,4-dihydroxy 2-butanone 4-phosphate synthase/GTP cyclohydrolase II
VHDIFKRLTAGEFVILQDDAGREDEADLIIAAEHLTYDKLNFMLREAGGFICVAMAGELLDKLQIPQMVYNNNSQFNTPFTLTVEAAKGVTTGVSVADRLTTIQTLINPRAIPADIVMPGHISPLRAAPRGVLERQGHTEGSVDLMQLAGLTPAAVICELMNLDGTMMRGAQLIEFAQQHNIAITDIASLRQHRLQTQTVLKSTAECQLPLESAKDFSAQVFVDELTGLEHVAVYRPATGTPYVRVHSQCFTGDVLHSQRCDCGQQLELSLQKIAQHGGVLIYLAQEGRGIGLSNKIKSYALQEQNMDTVEANHQLGFASDLREYYPAAQMLQQLGITEFVLLTNNPDKIQQLQNFGLKITREALLTTPNDFNIDYLYTKQNKLSHLLNLESS